MLQTINLLIANFLTQKDKFVIFVFKDRVIDTNLSDQLFLIDRNSSSQLVLIDWNSSSQLFLIDWNSSGQ